MIEPRPLPKFSRNQNSHADLSRDEPVESSCINTGITTGINTFTVCHSLPASSDQRPSDEHLASNFAAKSNDLQLTGSQLKKTLRC